MKRKDLRVGMVVHSDSNKTWNEPRGWSEDGEVRATRYTIEDTRPLKTAGRLSRNYKTGEVTEDTRPEFTTEAGEVIKGYALAVSNKTKWLGDDMNLILASSMSVEWTDGDGTTFPSEKHYHLLRLGDIRGLYDEVVPRLVEANKAAYRAGVARRQEQERAQRERDNALDALRAAGVQGVGTGGWRTSVYTLELTVEGAAAIVPAMQTYALLGRIFACEDADLNGGDFVQAVGLALKGEMWALEELAALAEQDGEE